MKLRPRLFLIPLIVLTLIALPAQAGHRALVAVGLGGDLAHAVDFARAGGETVRTLRDRGYGAATRYLYEDGAPPPSSAATEGASLATLPPPDGAATLETIRAAFAEATRADRSEDVFLVILAGHADLGASGGVAIDRARRSEWRFHLPGSDLTATELRALIDSYPGVVLLVAATPRAGALAEALIGTRCYLIASSQSRQGNMLAMPAGVARALSAVKPEADATALAAAVTTAVGAWYRENSFLVTEKPLIAGDTSLGGTPLFGTAATAWSATPASETQPDSSGQATTDPFAASFDPISASSNASWSVADAVILFRLIDLTVDERGEIHERRREVIKILSDQGRHAANLEFTAGGFDDTWTLIRAEVIQNGTRTPLGRDAIYEEKIGFMEAESGTPRHVSIRPTGMAPGSIVDIEYVHRTRTFAGASAPAGEWMLAAEYPIDRLAIRIAIPRRSKLRAVTRRLPVLENRESRYLRTWQTVVRHLPALRPEPYAPPLPDLVPRLLLVEPESWDEIALWYAKVAEGARLPDSTVAAAARRQLDGRHLDDSDTIVALYDWVARSIRYVSVPLGTHSYKPSPAAGTLRRGFGDCKDKASLLIAALASCGQEAYITLIGAGMGELIEEAPRVSAFNHAIVAIPRDTGWFFLDPTSEVAPCGTLPVMDEGRTVLIIRGEKGILAQTPIAPAKENRLEVERRVQPDSTGVRVIETRSYRGQNAFLARMMRQQMSVDDWQRAIADELARHFSGAELDSVAYDNLDIATAPFIVRLEYRLPTPAGLRPVPIYSALSFPPGVTRTLPISLPATLWLEETVTIDATGFETAALPATIRIMNEAGELVIEFERLDDGLIRARHRLVLPSRDLPATAYADLLALTKPPAIFLGAPVVGSATESGLNGWWLALGAVLILAAALGGALIMTIILKRRQS